ncbi:unnamed protein product, partial [marine sediment metagenome]
DFMKQKLEVMLHGLNLLITPNSPAGTETVKGIIKLGEAALASNAGKEPPKARKRLGKRDVVYKFLNLPYSIRKRILNQLGVKTVETQNYTDAFKYIRECGKLGELCDAVDAATEACKKTPEVEG